MQGLRWVPERAAREPEYLRDDQMRKNAASRERSPDFAVQARADAILDRTRPAVREVSEPSDCREKSHALILH